MLGWVHLWRYCVDRGDTPEAVERRLRSGHWTLGVHANKPEGCDELWVNLDAVMDWCAGGERLAKLPVGTAATMPARGNARPAAVRTDADTIDTAGIAVLMGCRRSHVTDRVTKQPGFPAPVMNASQRLRRWRRADVMRYIGRD